MKKNDIMKNLDKKMLDGVIKDADKFLIIITDKTVFMHGKTPDILTGYTILTKQLLEELGQELVKKAQDFANMNEEELLEDVIKLLKDYQKGNK